MGADEQRRIPVPAVGLFAGAFDGLDGHPFAALAVVTLQPAVLRLGVDDVGVDGVHLGFKSVACLGDVPIAVDDAAVVDGSARAAQGEIVLRAAVHVVERRGIVHGYTVKLRNGQIGLEVPAAGVVPSFVEAPVTAEYQVLGVGGVDPSDVVVHVLAALAQAFEGLAAVFGPLGIGVHRVDHIDIVRAREELHIVVSTGGMVALLLEAGAPVRTPVQAMPFDHAVDHVGVHGRNGEGKTAFIAAGQAVLQFVPRFATVFRLVQCTFRTARNIGPHMASTLVGRGIEHFGVAGIHMHFVEASVV